VPVHILRARPVRRVLNKSLTTKAASARAKKTIQSGRCISLLLRALTQKQQPRLDNPQPGAGALTQRHERLIKATARSIGRSPFNQRLHAAAQCFCCNHKAARLAFEYLHLGPCSRKLHPLAAARASHVLAVTHWNMSPSRNSQGGPLGPGTSPSAGTVCNNRAN
jgi:hypothetical protein